MKRQKPLSLKILLPLRHCFCVGACARVKDVAGEIPREARRCRKVTLILVDFLPSRSSGSEAQKHKFYLHIEEHLPLKWRYTVPSKSAHSFIFHRKYSY